MADTDVSDMTNPTSTEAPAARIATSTYTNARGQFVQQFEAAYGLTDDRGRAVGGIVSIVVEAYDGTVWVRSPVALRDGQLYGPAFPKTSYKVGDLAAARSKALELLAKQGKAYTKKFGAKSI